MIDARQRRTREALFKALDQLLEERPFREISVRELTDRAGIGRQTFYRHFDGLGMMLERRLETDLAEQRAIVELPEVRALGFVEWVLRVLEFGFAGVAEAPHLYRVILSGEAGGGALARYRDQIATFLAIAPPRPGGPEDRPQGELAEYAQSFYAGAITAMLVHWIDQGCRPDAAAMSRLFLTLVVAGRPD